MRLALAPTLGLLTLSVSILSMSILAGCAGSDDGGGGDARAGGVVPRDGSLPLEDAGDRDGAPDLGAPDLGGRDGPPADGAADSGSPDSARDASPPDAFVPCADDPSCDDGDPCNGEEICNADGRCAPGAPIVCEDDGDRCTLDTCDPTSGECVHPESGECCTLDEDCDDGDRCTLDACGEDRACGAAAIPGCCLEDAACGEGGRCLVSLESCAVAPAPGAVVISEIMFNPDAVGDRAGEWIELANIGDSPVLLNGWTLAGEGDERHEISAGVELRVEPGAFFVLARDGQPEQNGGVVPGYVYEGFNLSNAADQVIVLDALGGEVDAVAYGAGWPLRDATGASLSLDPGALDPAANDDPARWCAGAAPWAGGDRGSPGEANPPCAPPACEPNPCDTPPDPGCDADGLTRLAYPEVGRCAADPDGAPICSYDPVPEDCAAGGRVCRGGLCTAPGPRNPAPGEVVISEIMYDTDPPLDESRAEWFELVNVGARPVGLDGCVVSDAAGNSTDVAGMGPEGLRLDPGALALFARSGLPAENGGLMPDHLFDFALNNGGDEIALRCGGALIDRIAWGGDFPRAQGASLSLDPGALDAGANDLAGAWCLGRSPYADGHLGTPGAPNPSCAERVDWCRLQFPLDAQAEVNVAVEVFGRLFEAGVSDASDGTDPDPRLLAQAGLGPEGSDPAADPGWSWFDAAPNPGWSAAAANEPGNDEYLAQVSAAVAARYALAFRVSADSGRSWTYCDRAAGQGSDGSEDGYQIANAGALEVVLGADPCAPNPCDTPPPDACDPDGITRIAYPALGACAVVVNEIRCDYPAQMQDCSQGGELCVAGACVPPAPRQPAIGEVIVSEIMYDPQAPLNESEAEWFELLSVAGEALSLDGCAVADAAGNQTGVAGLILRPGQRAIFARSDDPLLNGGLAIDHLFDFALNNDGDLIALRCDAGVIDQVAYDDGPDFPDARGASIALDPGAADALANDAGARWCLGRGEYAGGHLGSPGEPNPSCAEAVDWCRLQFPLDPMAAQGEALTVFGRVFEPGLTDRGDGTDVDPRLLAQAGLGPDGSDPAADPGWQWLDAAPNPGWSALAANELGNDEYQADLLAPAPGAYDLAYRFSADGGFSWTYCDRAAGPGADGSEDGYQIANAGDLQVAPQANPCDPNPCDAPPADDCAPDGLTLRTYPAIGACAEAGGVAECTYDPQLGNCGDQGLVCALGACGRRLPLAGEVIISELLYDPEAPIAETQGEWIELTNTTNEILRLAGCTLADAANNTTLIGGGLEIAGGGVALFARSLDPALNGGLAADHVFGFALNNDADTVTLDCAGVIDAVAYDDGGAFPDARQTSIALDQAAHDALANDDGAAWCLGRGEYGAGHYGTPGAANPGCDEVLDWCRLQSPTDINDLAGATVIVYGRMFEAGVSDRGDSTDPAPAVWGQVGYGADGTDPSNDPSWRWTAAGANVGWSAVNANEPNNDEYQADLVLPAAGTWDLAYRFSADGGRTWTYCDRAAGLGADGSEDGYQIDNAGSLISR